MSIFAGFLDDPVDDGLGFEDEMTPAEQHAMNLAIVDHELIGDLMRARIRRGLTEDQLGAALGISGATVRAFEGLQTEPTLQTLRRYAHALGVTITHTVTDRQEPTP
ncbi:helix-turn-helix domain-containing protein [Curtobacterium citreum]